MHLVVVGGSGFLGRHFVRTAFAAGHRVTVVCREPCDGFPREVAVVTGGIEALCEQTGLLGASDAICHLASTTFPATSYAAPAREFTGNVLPTVALLEAMRRAGKGRILFLSSGGAIYGIPKAIPIDEGHPTDPISPYGIGKLTIEKTLGFYAAVHGFRPVSIRPANPYGPDQGRVGQVGAVWTFLQMIREGRTATLYGDGSVVRDFVHVSDLCALMLSALEQDAVGVFNCGGGTGTSLRELIEELERATGKSLAIERRPARAFDPPVILLDIAKARRELGWSPRIGLADGVAGLIDGAA